MFSGFLFPAVLQPLKAKSSTFFHEEEGGITQLWPRNNPAEFRPLPAGCVLMQLRWIYFTARVTGIFGVQF